MDRLLNSKWQIGSLVAFALLSTVAFAQDPPLPVPAPKCDMGPYSAPLKKFADIDPEKKCSAMAQDYCTKVQDEDHKDVSYCVYVYGEIQKAVSSYLRDLAPYCSQLNKAFESCANGDPNSFLSCTAKAADEMGGKQQRFSAFLKSFRDKIVALDVSSTRKRIEERFKYDKNLLLGAVQKNPDGSIKQPKCGKDFRGNFTERDAYKEVLGKPTSDPESPFEQLREMDETAKQFVSSAATNASRHQEAASNFNKQAQTANSRQSNMSSNDQNKSSDITGTKMPTAAMPKASGGGGGGSGSGSAGGMSGASQAPASALPGGSTGASGIGPASTGGDSASKAANAVGTTGPFNNGQESAAAVGQGSPDHKISVATPPGGSPGLPGLSSASGTAAGNGTSASSAYGAGMMKPSSASASGGGGGGGGLGGYGDLGAAGIGEKRCMSKDCQALTATNSQFASVGSLGAAPGGLGALDGLGSLDSSSLDNLLKDDKTKGGGASLDATMGALDAATAGMEAGANAPGDTQGADIGGANGGDLFQRMHQYHERAQKRGMVVGLTRKL